MKIEMVLLILTYFIKKMMGCTMIIKGWVLESNMDSDGNI